MNKFYCTLLLLVLNGLISCKTTKGIETMNTTDTALVELAKVLSENNPLVLSRVQLFINDKSSYFKTYNEELYQRGIESKIELRKAIALVDSLEFHNYSVGSDFDTEGDEVLLSLDKLSNHTLSANQCFFDLVDSYRAVANYNAIGNFLFNSKLAPMPYFCIDKAGYKLASIDADTDSYDFILVKNEQRFQIENLSKKAGINIIFFE